MIVFIAAMMGCIMGVFIADSHALLSILKRGTATWAARISRSRSLKTESEIPEIGEVKAAKSKGQPAARTISTGLSSINAIRYYPQADSMQIAFELENVALIHIQKLSSPDRIYIDLRDNRPEQGTLGNAEQKAFSIDGDLISRIRIAKRELDVIRIVLDLKRSCGFTYQIRPGSSTSLILKLLPNSANATTSKL